MYGLSDGALKILKRLVFFW